MTATTAPPDEFSVLDRLIARALGALRVARTACAEGGTPQEVDLRTRAEENLDALLDFRSAATDRPLRGPSPTIPHQPDRLPT